jgi:2-iminobutanoate/2-iminopropanoate deaminase
VNNPCNSCLLFSSLHRINQPENKFGMQKSKIIHPVRKPGFNTGAYSDGVVAGGFLFVSGQAAVDFNTSTFVLGTIEEETHLTLQNIKAIIEAAGATMDDVVKSTAHLADINDFDRYNKIYAEYFTGIKPARTTVQSVLAEGIKVEIDCIVKLPG